MKMPIAVYVCYGFYTIYTGFYLYNRTHGRSAQFGVTRVEHDSSKALKISTDFFAYSGFLFITGVIIRRTFSS